VLLVHLELLVQTVQQVRQVQQVLLELALQEQLVQPGQRV
jgi:hypothetical protein